jgi:hypothetical protein
VSLLHALQESDKEEPLLAQREGSFRSANSADSFTSARSRAQSNVGEFRNKVLLQLPLVSLFLVNQL